MKWKNRRQSKNVVDARKKPHTPEKFQGVTVTEIPGVTNRFIQGMKKIAKKPRIR